MKFNWTSSLRRLFSRAFNSTGSRRSRRVSQRHVQILEARLVMAADIDDQITEAIPLNGVVDQVTASDSIDAVADELGDVDMFAISVVGGQKLNIDVDHDSGSTLNSLLRLFTADGRQLSTNDNAAAPGETVGTEAFLTANFATSGTYYIAVSASGNSAYLPLTGTGDRAGTTGGYTLTVTPLDADDQPGEVTSLGALISDLKPRAASIELPFDVDVYKFAAAAGQVVGLDVDIPAGSTLNSYLRVFDSSGTEIAANDDAAIPDSSTTTESYVTFTPTDSGDFYVTVSSEGNESFSVLTGLGDTTGSSTGGYSLIIEYLDPNDQMAEATAIASTLDQITVSGSLTQKADVVLYSFTAYNKQKIAFDIDHTAGTWNSYLRVFSSTGAQVVANDNAAAPGETAGTEAYATYEFRADGTYYVGVSLSGNSSYNISTGLGDRLGATVGDFSLTLTPLDADDQLTEAVSLGELLSKLDKTGTLDAVFDVDLYKFTGFAGQTVGIDLDHPTGSTLDSYLRLFDAIGTELASNDDSGAPSESGTSLDSYISQTLPADGLYYIAVSAAGNEAFSVSTGLGDAAGSTFGTYVLQLLTVDSDDEVAESIVDLEAIANTVTTSVSLDFKVDVDLLKFTAQAGQKIAIDVDHTSTWNSFLRVFNSTGTQVASNDNAAAPGETVAQEPYLIYEVRTTGTYYVGLSGAGNSSYMPLTGLGDRVATFGTASLILSPADPDDSLTEVLSLGNLTTTLTKSLSIENSLDVDLIPFTAYSGQRVAIDLDHPTGSILDSYVRLFSADGTEVAANDDAAASEETLGVDSYLVYDVTTTGTYYIGVSASDNNSYSPVDGSGDVDGGSFGAYAVNIASIDSDDQISEATSLGATTDTLTTSGTISVSTDADLVSFTVTAGQRLEFDLDHINGSTLNSYLRIFDSTGRQLAVNDNAAGPGETVGTEAYLLYTFTASGTFYAGVSNAANRSYSVTNGTGDTTSTAGATGEYRLTISTGDFDDQISEATNLGTISSLQRRDDYIEFAKDVDIYKFTVTAGQHVGFDIDTSGNGLDSYVKILNASGTVLASNDDGSASAESSSGTDSYLEYTFNTAGTYYIAVSSAQNTNYDIANGTGDTSGTTGAYTLIAQTVPNSIGFQITLTFDGLTASQQAIFQQAANRWAEIILGDLPDVTVGGETIDDVKISASARFIDGVGRILGQAAPTGLRSDTYLPYQGFMQFDSADMASMESSGQLYPVILHEMGHVLGIGTIWRNKGLLTGAGTSNPRFIGAQATAAYNRIFNNTETSVPVENTGGSGTQDAHWRDTTMPYEIMTGYISSRNYITEITVGSLADLGYFVELAAADAYQF